VEGLVLEIARGLAGRFGVLGDHVLERFRVFESSSKER